MCSPKLTSDGDRLLEVSYFDPQEFPCPPLCLLRQRTPADREWERWKDDDEFQAGDGSKATRRRSGNERDAQSCSESGRLCSTARAGGEWVERGEVIGSVELATAPIINVPQGCGELEF